MMAEQRQQGLEQQLRAQVLSHRQETERTLGIA